MRRATIVIVASLCGCSALVDFEGYEEVDGGFADAGDPRDGGVAAPDSGPTPDGGERDGGDVVRDGGDEPRDGGDRDGGPERDAGPFDAGFVPVRTSSVAVLPGSVCATENGAVYCWGRNWNGELGRCDFTMGDGGRLPSRVMSLPNAPYRMTGGERTVCAIDDNDAATCWGRSSQRILNTQLPDRTCNPRALTMGAERFLEISVGLQHMCGIQLDGRVYCWGHNGFRQLGDGTGVGSRNIGPAAIIEGDPSILQVIVELNTSCIVTFGGEVRCWGANDNNWMGLASADTVVNTATVVPAAPTGVIAMDLNDSGDFACALFNGRVGCFGDWSECPNTPGTWTDFFMPAGDAVDIAVGNAHACALNDQGSVYCWGANNDWQLEGREGNTCLPKLVSGLPPAKAVFAADSFTCATAQDDTLYCWGSNRYAQLGVDPSGGAGRFDAPLSIQRPAQ